MPLNDAWLSFFFRIRSNLVIVKPADNLRQNRRLAGPRYFHFFPCKKLKIFIFAWIQVNSPEFRQFRLNSGEICDFLTRPFFCRTWHQHAPFYMRTFTLCTYRDFYNTWTFMCERDLVWPRRYFFLNLPFFRLNSGNFRLNSGNFRLNSGNFRLNSGNFCLNSGETCPFFAWIFSHFRLTSGHFQANSPEISWLQENFAWLQEISGNFRLNSGEKRVGSITTRRQVEKAAEGKDLPSKISQVSIVRWDADGRNVRPGQVQFI